MHVGSNMLFLWIFGNNIEDAMGPVKYLGFYVAGGLAAAGSQIGIDLNSQVPMIGASGAVAAILGAYLVLYPKNRVLVLIWLIVFCDLYQGSGHDHFGDLVLVAGVFADHLLGRWSRGGLHGPYRRVCVRHVLYVCFQAQQPSQVRR